MSDFNIEIESGTSKKLLTAGKYIDRDIVVTAKPLAYEDAEDGERLYDVVFASGNFTPVDDVTKAINNNGTIYDGYGAYEPAGWKGEHRKNLSKFPIVSENNALKVDGSDTTGVADHRYIGRFPMYDLENKTYTYEFEYFRNFDYRHKFYFACGTFIDKDTGSTITGDWCDPNMPCLAIQLTKHESTGKIMYNLVRQSSIIWGNTTNIHHDKEFDFPARAARYRHNVQFATDMGTATISFISDSAREHDVPDTDGYTSEIIWGYTGERIKIGGEEGIIGDRVSDEYGSWSGGFYVHYDSGITDTFYPTGRWINDTVEVVAPDDFTANMKIVLKGGAKQYVTLWKGRGGLVMPETGGTCWKGYAIPIDFEIYHTVNGEDMLIADGCVYQPADVPLVCGVGNWDTCADGQYYGVRNLSIYKGDTVALEASTQPNIQPLTITENGTYTPTGDVDGYSPITVEVEASGGVLTAEDLTISETGSYRFYKGAWDVLLEKLGDKITTKGLRWVVHMFTESKVEIIPFKLNFGTSAAEISNMFRDCVNLKAAPEFENCRVADTNYLFYNCHNLRDFPTNFENGFIPDAMVSTGFLNDRSYMFYYCHSLRSVPMALISRNRPQTPYYRACYYNGFDTCVSLDELINMPLVNMGNWTSNAFTRTVADCARLKNFTFELNNGSPYAMSWKSQNISLQVGVGFCRNADMKDKILNYNSGITADKEVKDDASYQALKHDPDWFTCNKEYSRYNHDSAVATINSLPDTSEYLATQSSGTNTITFNGESGSKTDGGAINTLTEEEIAVATAKGWTVAIA